MRVRLIEAACRTPAVATTAPDEVARRVIEIVRAWEGYVAPAPVPGRPVLGIPKS